VLLAPPFISTEQELDMVVDRLEDAINAAVASCAA
jgi:adenosylmethionine-8-amino-7-oxononanoate aminotransferase